MMQWLGSLQIHDFYSTKQRLLNQKEEPQKIEGAVPSLEKEKTKTEADANMLVEVKDSA